MGNSPSIPKGTRDFNPVEMTRRNYIFNSIRSVFRLYGYQPIETPAMENLASLLGKYGEEGDKLLFRVLNSGDFLSKVPPQDLSGSDSGIIAGKISDKGLRYDLTVPFARYVVQHRNDISFPFKRFQIQPVWRADRPQKGRYREFFQCDVDVIGSDSLYNEYELIQIINEVFSRLKIRNVIKINNRKILAGISEVIGEKDRIVDITVAIDKLDKIGLENVNLELKEKGISEAAINNLQPVLFLEGSIENILAQLKTILAQSEIGMRGIEEMEILYSYLQKDKLESELELDLTLARGLNYYTGAIIEVEAVDVPMGSICGGGRYDDLAGVFGLTGVSGVGVSFGADRIYDVINQLDIFPERGEEDTKLMFINFSEDDYYSLNLLKGAREAGICSIIYPSAAKIKKQMAYANARKIPYVAIAGPDEVKKNMILLKDMKSGDQELLSPSDLLARISP